MASIFDNAINSMNGNKGEYREPESFLQYVSNNGIKAKNTAQHISIQSYSQLAPELKSNNIMVFRLGSRQNEKGTFFSLIKSYSNLRDYFLFDDSTFKDATETELNIAWESDNFVSFSIIPSLTETSHVNLSLVSGVLEKALSLDQNSITVPATGRGNYTFEVKPRKGTNISWLHNSGQVEIDSIFSGTRNGVKHLFVIEAKSGKFPDSLAKHKLMYPVSSIAPKVSQEYIITPVYIRIEEDINSIKFYISECESFNPTDELFIDSLVAKHACIIKILK